MKPLDTLHPTKNGLRLHPESLQFLLRENSEIFGDFPPLNFTNIEETHGKIHHVSWENPLFQWPFSIAMLLITRG